MCCPISTCRSSTRRRRCLKAMRRPGDQEKTLERIRAWRAICPDLTIRSTFIVGFPGETEDDFACCSTGSRKRSSTASAPSNTSRSRAPPPTISALSPCRTRSSSRRKRFMERQQAISAKKLKAKVGKRLEVIVDEAAPRAAKGRSKGDAPEIDGAVHVATRRPLRAGDIVKVKIEQADAYDLWGTAV